MISLMTHLEGLNIQQKKAVEHTTGPLLIVAGAGAGKTKTLTHRILNLIKSGVAPHSILAITFTNKAAKEMRDRMGRLLESDKTLNLPISSSERPFISTFHSLGVHIIKENALKLGLTRHFTIYDRNDSKRAIKEAIEACQLDPKQFEPSKILSVISREKGNLMTHTTYADKWGGEYWNDMVAKIWEKYENILKKEKSLDFDDLLLKTALLLKNDVEVRTKYQNLWQYVHIDEYQDTNAVQYQIASLLADKHHNLCVVGDADQTIYSWRGANIQNILNFEKDYQDATVIVMEENYRSTQNILAAANQVIIKNVMRKDKNLFTKNIEGEKITVFSAYEEGEEANFVAETAKKIIAGGVSPREIAVLYRANFQSRVLEEAFLHKSVPYQILGTRFFDRKEVKDVLSFIKASLNRDSFSDVGRVINIPPRGIGKVTLLKIFDPGHGALPPAMQQKVATFMALLERIKQASLTLPPSQVVKMIIADSGMEAMYRKDGEEGMENIENIRELVTLASKYDVLPLGEGLEKMLEEAALATDQDELTKDKNAVKLMTVHASKGLEFDYVIIPGLETDLFPHKKLNEDALDKNQAEEERRLFYVALTRARKKIYLTHTVVRTIFGAQKVNTPSEFISDIDADLIESGEREEVRGVKAIFIDF